MKMDANWPRCIICGSPMVAYKGIYIPGQSMRLALGIKSEEQKGRHFIYLTCAAHAPEPPDAEIKKNLRRVEQAILRAYREKKAIRMA